MHPQPSTSLPRRSKSFREVWRKKGHVNDKKTSEGSSNGDVAMGKTGKKSGGGKSFAKTVNSLKSKSNQLSVPGHDGARRKSLGGDKTKEDKESEDDASKKQEENALKKSDSLEKLMAQVNSLKALHPVQDTEEPEEEDEPMEETKEGEDKEMTEEQKKARKMKAFAKVFGPGDKRSLKALAKAEIRRQAGPVDNMMMQAKVVAAFGRRNFDRDEIEGSDASSEETDEEGLELSEKVKRAKSKYMAMYAKKEDEPTQEEKDEEENQKKAKAKASGAWDTVTNLKVLPTLMRVKKEWVPPDWDQIMEKMKEEGRDLATIDADLKEISRTQQLERTKTGKYLMPEDITWCRKRTRFKEKDLLNWFRRFRTECPKGELAKTEMEKLFKVAFPISNGEFFVEIVYELLDPDEQNALDFKVSTPGLIILINIKNMPFKDFILAMDAVTCKTTEDKMRWATSLYDKNKTGSIDIYGLKCMLKLIDEIEDNGYMNGPSEEELEELLYRKKLDPLKLVEDRAQDIWEKIEKQPDGRIDLEQLFKTPSKYIYARE